MRAGHTASGWSRYLGAMFAVLTARATLIFACALRPRWKSGRQQAHEQVRRDDRGKSFRNISEWASWPKLEVFRFLRAGARGLSIHEFDDWILQNTDYEVVFKYDPKAPENGCQRNLPGFTRTGLRN